MSKEAPQLIAYYLKSPMSMKNFESKERLNENPLNENSRKFIYRDNNDAGNIIFECVTESITDADKMYEEQFNIKAEKQSHIACSIQKFNPDSEEWEDVWRGKK